VRLSSWALALRKSKVTKLTDRILEILRSCPYGLTAKEVASRLGATAGNISSRLSKLAAYGIIIKTRGGSTPDVSHAASLNLPSMNVPSTNVHIPRCAVYNAPIAASATAPFLPHQ
jgi:DNA-binding Lrp family transcriptional regulator